MTKLKVIFSISYSPKMAHMTSPSDSWDRFHPRATLNWMKQSQKMDGWMIWPVCRKTASDKVSEAVFAEYFCSVSVLLTDITA